jgi:hypothetical protein
MLQNIARSIGISAAAAYASNLAPRLPYRHRANLAGGGKACVALAKSAA